MAVERVTQCGEDVDAVLGGGGQVGNQSRAGIRAAEVAGWAGLGIMWCGIGLRLWSFRTLGRYCPESGMTEDAREWRVTGSNSIVAPV